jgi:hypothetical protein
MTEQNAQLEGDDISDEAPLRVICFGSQFVAVDNPEVMASASGPACLQTMAKRLLQAGIVSERQMILFRANQNIGRTTVGQAAQQETWVEHIKCTPGQKVAVLGNNTTTGSVSVTELSD